MRVFCALIFHKIYNRLTHHLRLDTTLEISPEVEKKEGVAITVVSELRTNDEIIERHNIDPGPSPPQVGISQAFVKALAFVDRIVVHPT